MLNNLVSRWPVLVITYNLEAFEQRRKFMAQQLATKAKVRSGICHLGVSQSR